MSSNTTHTVSIIIVALISLATLIYVVVDSTASSKREAVGSDDTPGAIAPYSKAMWAGNTLYISGQIGMNANGTFNSNDVSEQTQQTLMNVGNLLEAAGLDFDNVVRVTVMMTDMGNYGAINDVYETFFPDPRPTRSAFQVGALPKEEALVEIDCIAIK